MLNEAEFETLIKARDYADRFRAVCRDAVQSRAATYLLMERYAHVNGFAGSGVALLAGNIGYERDLFLDPAPGPSRDRGMKIAAKIFTATIDEHGGPRGAGPHRSMAQACVDKVAEFAGLGPEMRVLLELKPPAFLEGVERFKKNYSGASRKPDDLLRSIGYHVASEYLADIEYQILDEEIWHNNPHEEFRAVVRRTRTQNGWGGPWAWITVHGHYGQAENDDGHGVEEEHFQFALEALRFVEKYPPLDLPPAETKRLIAEGAAAFREDFLDVFGCITREIAEEIDRSGALEYQCRDAGAKDDRCHAAGKSPVTADAA